MLGRYRSEVARVAEPVARAMVGLRLRPNQLSCLGLVGSVIAAAAFAADQRRAGAVCLALAGALDILDGAVARASGQVSPFGAFLDSVLDRYSDLLVLAGLVFLFARLGRLEVVVAVLLALIGTVMVSYTRARAESVGVECRVGLMERGERMLRADRRGPPGPPRPRDLGGRARGERDGGPPDRAHLARHPRRPALIGTVRRSLLIHWPRDAGRPDPRSPWSSGPGSSWVSSPRGPGRRRWCRPGSLQRYREAHVALAGGEYARARALLDELPPEFLLADTRPSSRRRRCSAGATSRSPSRATARSPSASRTPSSGRRPSSRRSTPRSGWACGRTPSARPGGSWRARRPIRRRGGSWSGWPRRGPPRGRWPRPSPTSGAAGSRRRRPPGARRRGRAWRTWRSGAGLSVAPLTIEEQFLQAQRLADAGEQSASVRLLESLLAQGPELPVRHRALARMAPMLGRLARSDEAIARLDAALTEPVTPSRAALLYELGRLLQRSGQTGRGAAMYERLLAEHPEAPQPGRTATIQLARARAELGQFDAAREAFQRVVARYPDSAAAASARWEVAWLEYRDGPAPRGRPRVPPDLDHGRERAAGRALLGGPLARPAGGERGGPGPLSRGAEPRPARVLRHPRRAPRAGEGAAPGRRCP